MRHTQHQVTSRPTPAAEPLWVRGEDDGLFGKRVLSVLWEHFELVRWAHERTRPGLLDLSVQLRDPGADPWPHLAGVPGLRCVDVGEQLYVPARRRQQRWRVSAHARQRCGEMGVQLDELAAVLCDAATDYPGREGRRILTADGLAVVTDAARSVVITVLWDGESCRGAMSRI